MFISVAQAFFEIYNQKKNYLKRECNSVNSFTTYLQLILVFIKIWNRKMIANEEDLVRSDKIVR